MTAATTARTTEIINVTLVGGVISNMVAILPWKISRAQIRGHPSLRIYPLSANARHKAEDTTP